MEADGKDRPSMLALVPPATPGIDGTPQQPKEEVMETYVIVLEETKKWIDAEAGAVQIILNGIDNDIYSIIDACPNAMEISQDATRNKGKSIFNSPPPTYDLEPEVVVDDEASSKKKEIDKLMALILMYFKKIYKPTNNYLRTSLNTRNMNIDNTPRSDRRTGFKENQEKDKIGSKPDKNRKPWIWLEKEPPRSILTWDDLVIKFINQFFPPSKTTNLRNEITRFQQRFDESFYEAWDRFNDLLRVCPHHGFSKLHHLDTFYNALNVNDQDSLNSATGGNFLDKMPRECLKITESKSKVCQSRAKAVIAKVSMSSSTPNISSEVSELKDMVRALLLDKMLAMILLK
nr:reverse transcriptase domain-containing protein [Tanacetum cinerariifolium]